MPCTWSIESDPPLARFRVVGTLDIAEVTAASWAMLESPDFTPGIPQLIDLQEVTGASGGYEELRQLAATGARWRERLDGRLAFVADRPLAFGMARMYKTLLALAGLPLETRIFRHAHPALSWLRAAEAAPASPATDDARRITS